MQRCQFSHLSAFAVHTERNAMLSQFTLIYCFCYFEYASVVLHTYDVVYRVSMALEGRRR